MTIANKVNEELIGAMKAKDAEKLSALRNLKSALANELLAKKRKVGEELTDEESTAVIKRLVKQRKDSIEQFKSGGRKEMAKAEEAELKILEAYLPAMLNETEIMKIAEKVKEKLGSVDKSKLGQFIGAVMKETKGRADGETVKKTVEKLFS